MMASEQEGDGGFIIDVNGKVEISKPKEAYEAYKQEQQNNTDLNSNNNNVDNTDSNSHKTTDTFTPTFIPPSITSSKDLLINAKELINHSIISAKG
ncbi:hypothetical protein, partial [Helicobacter sp. 13S00482-2]|uniref:hypothetical protein n=1 Tax=Helicobacter sp. 13S00482-2 TaxID=1476200 RepID=UPI001C5DDD6E